MSGLKALDRMGHQNSSKKWLASWIRWKYKGSINMHGMARSSPMCFCRVAPQAAGDRALTNHEFSTIWIHLGVLRIETTRKFCKATILGTERGVVSAKKTKFWGYVALILWMVSCFFALTTACVSSTNHLIY